MTVEYPLEVAQQMARERDELRAEVEYWRDACGADHIQRVKTLEAEIERLRAELKTTKAVVADLKYKLSEERGLDGATFGYRAR